jgi:ABC-type Fe3+ transport system permease subunit
MVGILITLLGSLVWTVCVVYLVSDCRGNVSASMGGEMTFRSLWMIGGLVLALGILLLWNCSLFWALLLSPLLHLISFPLGGAVQRCVCVPFEQPPTGFQQFIRRVEQRDRSPSDE